MMTFHLRAPGGSGGMPAGLGINTCEFWEPLLWAQRC